MRLVDSNGRIVSAVYVENEDGDRVGGVFPSPEGVELAPEKEHVLDIEFFALKEDSERMGLRFVPKDCL